MAKSAHRLRGLAWLDRELRKLLDENRSIEEIKAELKKEGVDPAASIARIRAAVDESLKNK